MAFLQARVDEAGADFIKAVASGRGPPSQRRENFGQGRVYGAREALSRGMVDRSRRSRRHRRLAQKSAPVDRAPALGADVRVTNFSRFLVAPPASARTAGAGFHCPGNQNRRGFFNERS
jgi:ClpP class serine protease